jgi:hypothetical protein
MATADINTTELYVEEGSIRIAASPEGNGRLSGVHIEANEARGATEYRRGRCVGGLETNGASTVTVRQYVISRQRTAMIRLMGTGLGQDFASFNLSSAPGFCRDSSDQKRRHPNDQAQARGDSQSPENPELNAEQTKGGDGGESQRGEIDTGGDGQIKSHGTGTKCRMIPKHHM